MCAIVGLIRKPAREFCKPQGELAREMLAKMAHRGPDGTGFLECANVVLGHNRLAVIGIENGKQPISDERVGITVNGEFYRHDELKKRLFPFRHWQTDTDSEVLIPLYETFGIDKALEMLDGEFAFILHDRWRRRVYAARDRFGVKPLSWRESSGGIELASEVKAFSGSKCWNLDALCTGLAMHYPNLGDTVARDIFSVSPGHYLEIDVESGKVLREKRWWKPSWPVKKDQRDDCSACSHFGELLLNAVKARLRSDAKWCVSLSGGIDSSAVLGFASRVSSDPINCFTVSFPDAGDSAWNELEIAKKTAKHVGATLHEVEMPAAKMLDLLEDSIFSGEGFAVNGHVSCKHALAKAVHDAGFKSMLVGEGADECLLGYSHLKVDEFGAQCASPLMRGTETPCGSLLMPEKFSRLQYLPSFLKAKLSSGRKIEALLSRDFRETFKNHALSRQEATLLDFMQSGTCKAEKSAGAWLATAFPSYICKVLGDGQEMASSVEARLPFLDKALFEFSASLPLRLKSSATDEKKVLREVSGGFVPDEVRSRAKQPFQAPPLSWLLSDRRWKDFVGLCLSTRASGIFDMPKLEKTLQEVKSMSVQGQATWEPILMLVVSCSILSKKLKL